VKLWRISPYASLDGGGGLKVSGRFHTAPRAIVYAAETPAGALLEILVHLDVEKDEIPDNYRLIGIEVPDGEWRAATHWKGEIAKASRDATRAFGDRWFDGKGSLLLVVPGGVLPETRNVLINAAHPSARDGLRTVHNEPLRLDPRLF
jgi:RES domain-containing protein